MPVFDKQAHCCRSGAQNSSKNKSFHVYHKVPSGDGPYVMAKHAQLIDRNPEKAIELFWAALKAGDRVDSALKDMAIVMKQQGCSEDAIDAIADFRWHCCPQAQESLDNVLLDLYKSCGRIDEQIALLVKKLNLFYQGLAFGGRRSKTARSQGKKFQVSVEQEAARLLGNLGWAYMQRANYMAAEAVYRKAIALEPNRNKICNLGMCLMKQDKLEEASAVLVCAVDGHIYPDSHAKSLERAKQLLLEIDILLGPGRIPNKARFAATACPLESQELDAWPCWKAWQVPWSSSSASSSISLPPQLHLAALRQSDNMELSTMSTAHQQEVEPKQEAVSVGGAQNSRGTKQAEKLSGMVAAAVMLATCQDTEEGEAKGEVGSVMRVSSRDTWLDQDRQQALEFHGNGEILGSYMRRLPVFRDLTA